jgi:outer membrane protein TolC
MASIWRVESAAELVGAAQADFYPSVNLIAFAGLDTVFFNKFFKWASRTGYVTPAITLPIFTGGKLTANLRAHRAEFQEAIQTYNEVLLGALKEVADQIATLKAKDERLKAEKWIVRSKMENQQLVSLRHEHALDSSLQVLNAQDELLMEQFKQIQIEYENYQANIQLIKALGGGYHYGTEGEECKSN